MRSLLDFLLAYPSRTALSGIDISVRFFLFDPLTWRGVPQISFNGGEALSKLEAFKERMGWSFKWLSSLENDFNYYFRVTLDPDKPDYEYNYASAAALLQERYGTPKARCQA